MRRSRLCEIVGAGCAKGSSTQCPGSVGTSQTCRRSTSKRCICQPMTLRRCFSAQLVSNLALLVALGARALILGHPSTREALAKIAWSDMDGIAANRRTCSVALWQQRQPRTGTDNCLLGLPVFGGFQLGGGAADRGKFCTRPAIDEHRIVFGCFGESRRARQ